MDELPDDIIEYPQAGLRGYLDETGPLVGPNWEQSPLSLPLRGSVRHGSHESGAMLQEGHLHVEARVGRGRRDVVLDALHHLGEFGADGFRVCGNALDHVGVRRRSTGGVVGEIDQSGLRVHAEGRANELGFHGAYQVDTTGAAERAGREAKAVKGSRDMDS
uniref:hypothetical protein n=1 Tax=Streptomyces asoensis TaxID=249586 RepID=UPI00209C1A07|nr:hypothetical protein [Streptomyces asoensis]